MKKFINYLPIIAVLFTSGCYSISGTISKEPLAYLRITGVQDKLILNVDDASPVIITPQKDPINIQVTPTKHSIKIMRGDAIIVNRIVLLSDQQTLEISVP